MDKDNSSKKELWLLKKEAHNLAGLIWGDMDSAFGNRKAMYAYLQVNTRTGHIATLTKLELVALIKKLKRKANGSHLPRQHKKKERWWEQ